MHGIKDKKHHAKENNYHVYHGTLGIRAFSSTIVKNLAFIISKHYFYNFNASFYNIPNIKHFIFFTTSFKYYFFYNFLFLFCFYFFHPLSLVSLSLSLPLSLTVSPSLLLGLIVSTQQSNPPLATSHHNLTTTTTIKDPH